MPTIASICVVKWFISLPDGIITIYPIPLNSDNSKNGTECEENNMHLHGFYSFILNSAAHMRTSRGSSLFHLLPRHCSPCDGNAFVYMKRILWGFTKISPHHAAAAAGEYALNVWYNVVLYQHCYCQCQQCTCYPSMYLTFPLWTTMTK